MTKPLELTLHGAARTVTGSCHEFSLGASRLLVDCGMFQGSRTLEGLNAGAFGFHPGKLDGVVLTHAHIDHCGLLPRLVAQGYAGPIWCTQASKDLLEYMLADAGRIQERLDPAFGQLKPRRAAIHHRAERGPVAFAPGGEPE